MNDTEFFLKALTAFADLSAADQRALTAQTGDNLPSEPAVESVRLMLAEAIDGCEDEEIADALRGSDIDEDEEDDDSDED